MDKVKKLKGEGASATLNVPQEDRIKSGHSALVVVVMSHGDKDIVRSADGERVNIENDIVTPFDGAHCPALAGKPKLLFIQACRGKGIHLICLLWLPTCSFCPEPSWCQTKCFQPLTQRFTVRRELVHFHRLIHNLMSFPL